MDIKRGLLLIKIHIPVNNLIKTHTTKKFQGQRSSTLDQQGHQEKPQKTTQIIQKEEENW